MRLVLGGLLLMGCSRTTEASWLEGFGFSWQNANHRLSHLSVQLGDDTAQIAVIGGASTTGVAFDDSGTCLSTTCSEFDFVTDDADVEVSWVRASSDRARFASGALTLEVGADGASGEIELPLIGRARGEAVAFLSGVTLDTGDSLPEAAAAISCYDPRHGWHVRELGVSLGVATLADDRRSVRVPVQAAFRAGASGERVRACSDAVYDLAVVPITVSVAVVVGDGAQHEHEVRTAKTYPFNGNPFNPPEQPPPGEDEIAAAFVAPGSLAGWTALSWRFYPDEAEKGAYLRTWRFALDRQASTAVGHATNYSPVTQLDGFDYRFEGRIVEFEVEAALSRGSASGSLPAALDEAGEPVISTLSAE